MYDIFLLTALVVNPFAMVGLFSWPTTTSLISSMEGLGETYSSNGGWYCFTEPIGGEGREGGREGREGGREGKWEEGREGGREGEERERENWVCESSRERQRNQEVRDMEERERTDKESE